MPFPELCCEVAKLCDVGAMTLRDTKEQVIKRFTLEGVEDAFGWEGYGIECTKEDSLAFYESLKAQGNLIRDWLLPSARELKGNSLLNMKRMDFHPTVSKLIALLSIVLGKEDDTKFRKEFFTFIYLIGWGKKIRWGHAISEALKNQISSYKTTKRFCINSYLVYLLLAGKNRPMTHGDITLLNKSGTTIWKCYQKWFLGSRYSYFYMKTDRWEYEILKEIKGEAQLKRISNTTIDALKGHANFYLHHSTYTYIRVFGSQVHPHMLPRHVSNKIILMEFCYQLSFLHEQVWKKAATITLPIIVGEYACTLWVDVDNIKTELGYYGFK